MNLGPFSTARRAGSLPRAGVVLSIAVLAIVISAACTADDDPAPEGDPVRYATYPATTALGEGDGATLDGMLTSQGGCLVVEAEDGSVVVPVLPSSDTVWDDDAALLTVGSTEYRLGHAVSFGGGYIGAQAEVNLPGACADFGEQFLVSSP